MAIRLNLLAEAQALEQLRRRDPVKRMIWGALVVVALALVWMSSLQLQVMIAKGEYTQAQRQLAAKTNEYRLALETQKKSTETRNRLAALDQIVTNRFLQGTLLNALQQSTIDHVQLVRMRSEQNYTITEPGGAKKPAVATERINLTLEAKDTGPVPGDQINDFKQTLGENAYFQQRLGSTNAVRLVHLGTQQPGADGKPFVLFAVECRYPEKKR